MVIIEHCANGQALPGAARNRLLAVRRDIGDGGPVALPSPFSSETVISYFLQKPGVRHAWWCIPWLDNE